METSFCGLHLGHGGVQTSCCQWINRLSYETPVLLNLQIEIVAPIAHDSALMNWREPEVLSVTDNSQNSSSDGGQLTRLSSVQN
jgi:hypothetical protein